MTKLDLSWMIGRRIAAIRLVEPVSWWFEFSGQGSVRSDSLWRVVADGRIRASSEDHGHKFGLPQAVDSAERAHTLLDKATIRQASVLDSTGDLVVELETGTRLEVLVTSSGYESWALFCPNGDEVIAAGGGKIELVRVRNRGDR